MPHHTWSPYLRILLVCSVSRFMPVLFYLHVSIILSLPWLLLRPHTLLTVWGLLQDLVYGTVCLLVCVRSLATDNLGDIWKLIYSGIEKSQCSEDLWFSALYKYSYLLTYRIQPFPSTACHSFSPLWYLTTNSLLCFLSTNHSYAGCLHAASDSWPCQHFSKFYRPDALPAAAATVSKAVKGNN